MVLAVAMEGASIFKQPRRARVVERRARPEHAHILVDLVVCDAVILGVTAAGSFTKLIINLARVLVRKESFLAQPFCQLAVDPAIAFGVARRFHRLLNMDHASFDGT